MTLIDALPYGASVIVGLVTAWYTHRRATKAHKHTVFVDHQDLVNTTYEMVLGQMREEFERRGKAHAHERKNWEQRERVLQKLISDLQDELKALKAEIRQVRERETATEKALVEKKLEDYLGLQGKKEPGGPNYPEGGDLPT